MERVATALADRVFSVEDTVAEKDLVAVRLTASATQVGAFMGLPASGRRYTIGEIHLFRVRGERIVEHWHQYDVPALLQQLGASPGAVA
jgi:predicted ester cyclase